MNQLVPIAGAHKDRPCPKTVLTADGRIVTVTDRATGYSVRLTPARLYHYRGESGEGLAVLDGDGLVLLDLPGGWHATDLGDFARRAQIPLEDGRDQPPDRVRAVLAGRAPGWYRIRGLPLPCASRWRKPLFVGLGLLGLAVMAYLASLGMWTAWRGLSTVGRLLLDLLDAKWLVVAFSPALLLLRPALARAHRWRMKRGTVLGPPGGPCLSVKSGRKLQITRGDELRADLRIGENPGEAFSLLLYRFDDLTGLFVLDRFGHSLHHLPGPWPAEAADHFTRRHGLALAVHRVSREEYVTLTRDTQNASP